MKREFIERSKFLFLISLILLSLIQVGFLWFYQDSGASTPSESAKNSYDLKDYFQPKKIIISDGYDESHWVFTSELDLFKRLWSDGKSYIKDILIENEIVSKMAYTDDKWEQYTIKRSINFKFDVKYDISMLTGFLNLEEELKYELDKIDKMVILPDEDVNNNVLILISNGNTIYKYKMKAHSNADYDDIISSLKNDSNINNYNLLKEIFPNQKKAPFVFRADIPVMIAGDRYRTVPEITIEEPSIFKNYNISNSDSLNNISKNVLGKDKDSYDILTNKEDSIRFGNANNIYRIFRDGLFEYKYLHETEKKDKGNKFAAFEKAVDFINGKNLRLNKEYIFLSGIENNNDNGYYTFYFDYKVNGINLNLEKNITLNRESADIKHGIMVNASEERVLNCWWIIKEIDVIKDRDMKYNIGFVNLLDNIFKKYKDLNRNELSIENISLVYILEKNSKSTFPAWKVETMDNKVLIVPLTKLEQGE